MQGKNHLTKEHLNFYTKYGNETGLHMFIPTLLLSENINQGCIF